MLIPNRYEQYMDVAGQVAEQTVGREFVTVGGLCVLPETAAVLRARGSNLPKWRDSTLANALEVAEVIGNTALVALTLRMRKVPNKWADFWLNAKQYYQSLAQATRDPKGAAFSKAANIIRYMLFGECSGRLMGESVYRLGYPTIRDAFGLSVVQLKVVCDTDIQGVENINVFNYLWQKLEGNQPLLRQLGLSEHVSEVTFLTEQQEPILVLADHLAGAIHAVTTPGTVPPPPAIAVSDLQQIADAYRSLPNIVTVNSEFDVPYEAIFGDTRLGKLLWSDA